MVFWDTGSHGRLWSLPGPPTGTQNCPLLQAPSLSQESSFLRAGGHETPQPKPRRQAADQAARPRGLRRPWETACPGLNAGQSHRPSSILLGPVLGGHRQNTSPLQSTGPGSPPRHRHQCGCSRLWRLTPHMPPADHRLWCLVLTHACWCSCHLYGDVSP